MMPATALATVGSHVKTVASEVRIDLPSWTLALPFVVLLAVLCFSGYRDREQAAGRELTKLMRKAHLPDPGSDWVPLLTRQSRRTLGRVIGLYVGFIGWLPLSYWSAYGGNRSPPWPLLIPVGAALGTAAGHLLPLAIPAPAARVAVVRRRQLTDYVRPWELALASVSTVIPVAAVVIAILNVSEGTSTPVAALIVALVGVLSLALLAVLWWVVRRVLRQPVTAETDAGLEWGEVLRSQLLRDQLVAITFVSAGGGGAVLLWGLTRGMRGLPDWSHNAAVIVASACGIAFAGVIAAGLVDRRFVWVRTHVVSGQHR